MMLSCVYHLLHQCSPLMHAIACAHTSTCATSLMCKKWHVPLLSMTLIVWGIAMKKMKQRTKASNWIIVHFSLIFVILSFAWMLYFHVLYDFRIREKCWVNTIISLIYSKYSLVSFLKPGQNNLSNPEAYSEPCHTSKMECFAKIVNSWKSLKAVKYSCKALHLRFLTEFWICLCNLQFIVWENQGS